MPTAGMGKGKGGLHKNVAGHKEIETWRENITWVPQSQKENELLELQGLFKKCGGDKQFKAIPRKKVRPPAWTRRPPRCLALHAAWVRMPPSSPNKPKARSAETRPSASAVPYKVHHCRHGQRQGSRGPRRGGALQRVIHRL